MPLRFMAGLVILASIFHAASIVIVQDKGISPFFAAELFFLFKSAFTVKRIVIPFWSIVLFFLFLYFLYSVLFFPDFFNGVKVFIPEKGIDNSVMTGGDPLGRTKSQWAQLLYFLINSLCLLMFYLQRNEIGERYAYRLFTLAMVLVVGIGLWEFSAGLTGLFFPYSALFSNPGFSQMANATAFGIDRLNASFSEPSFAGGVLAASFWMFATGRNVWLAGLSFAALVLTFSGTGILAFMFGLIVSLRQQKVFITIVSVMVLFLAMIPFSGSGQYFEALLIDKLNSVSADVRLTSDVFSFDLLKNTFGFGAGLGSHRPSSLISAMLGNAGIPGLFLFSVFLLSFVVNTATGATHMVRMNHVKSIRFYLYILLAAQVVGIPDLNFSSLWVVLFVLAVVTVHISDERMAVLKKRYENRIRRLRL